MPGDIIGRAIRIGGPANDTVRVAIAEGDATLPFEALERLAAGLIITLAMRDRDLDDLALGIVRCKRRIVALDPQMLHPADKAQIGVAHQDTRQKPGFGEDLKAVADAENETAPCGMGAHGVHDGRPGGDGAAAQIIAIREAAGQHDEIRAKRQGPLAMPDERGFFSGGLRDGADRVLFTIGAGEKDDGGVHEWLMFSSLMACLISSHSTNVLTLWKARRAVSKDAGGRGRILRDAHSVGFSG